MASKKERDNRQIERLKENYRKFSDELLLKLKYERTNLPINENKKAFKAILKERGLEND
jgi:hypothetical protein